MTPARNFRDASNQTWLRRLHAVSSRRRVSSEGETLLSVHHHTIRQDFLRRNVKSFFLIDSIGERLGGRRPAGGGEGELSPSPTPRRASSPTAYFFVDRRSVCLSRRAGSFSSKKTVSNALKIRRADFCSDRLTFRRKNLRRFCVQTNETLAIASAFGPLCSSPQPW